MTKRRDRSVARGRSAAAALAGALLAAGSVDAAHAAGDVVEGVSDTPEDAQFVNVRYRCDGPSCRFDAVLDGVANADVTEYEWRFGDGRTVSTTSPSVTHEWQAPGEQSLTLAVHDQHCDPLLAEASFTTRPSSTPAPTEPGSGGGADAAGGALTAASVRLAQDARRTVSEPLGGSPLSGSIFVFVDAPADTASVAFRLVGSSIGVRNLRVERIAPFDLASGSVSSARPFDTRTLADGAYRLDVAARYADGRTDNVSVDIEVRNATPEPVAETPGPVAEAPVEPAPDANEPPTGAASPATPDAPDASDATDATLVFSRRSDRRRDRALAGAVLKGRVYPYLKGAAGADSVRFFIDDPGLTGRPVKVERSAPWDVAGSRSRHRAQPVDTRRLSTGRHVLSAEIRDAGRAYVVHASFRVVR